jgi:hypothetical protein
MYITDKWTGFATHNRWNPHLNNGQNRNDPIGRRRSKRRFAGAQSRAKYIGRNPN